MGVGAEEEAASRAAWLAARAAISASRRSQRTSGWRRTMPEAVQGASSKIASQGTPSHQVAGRAASAASTRADRPRRCRVCTLPSASGRPAAAPFVTLVVDAGLGANFFDKDIIRLAMRPDQ